MGSGIGRIAVRDRGRGNQLAVNKAGTLSRAFLATDETARRGRSWRAPGGSWPTCTRPVRRRTSTTARSSVPYATGGMIGHDSDLDLCYLSETRTRST